jgi:hypothetical protein
LASFLATERLDAGLRLEPKSSGLGAKEHRRVTAVGTCGTDTAVTGGRNTEDAKENERRFERTEISPRS